MQHDNILDMIDACLERLQTVRQLLTPSRKTLAIEALIKTSEGGTAVTKKKVRPAMGTKKKRKEELTAPLFSDAPVIAAEAPIPFPAAPAEASVVEKIVVKQVVAFSAPKPVVEAPPPIPRPRRKAQALPSALVHHVPAQPVFISAANVRHEQSQSVKAAPPKPAAAPLTAELLARRWIQSADL